MTRGTWLSILAYGGLAALALACLWLVSLAPVRLNWGRELLGATIAAVAMGIGLRLARPRSARLGEPGGPAAASSPPAPRPAPAPADTDDAPVDLLLSPREREVLRLLDAGLSNKLLARALSLSENTIKTHLANLYGKLGVSRRTEALAVARRRGLL